MAFTKLGQRTSSLNGNTSSSKRRTLTLFFLFISSLFFLISTSFFFHTPLCVHVIHRQKSNPQATFHANNVKHPRWAQVIHEIHSTPHKPLIYGLINLNNHEIDSHLKFDGTIENVFINLESVSSNITWETLFPEWINETKPKGSCPEIPMPDPDKYFGLDVVVAKLPCIEMNEEIDINGNKWKNGIRDVHRLQISLASANLLVENGIREEKDVYGVFIGKCEPMIEIFRCEDLIWHGGEYWVYKPNLQKLMEMIRMPVGSCALAQTYAGNSGTNQLQDNTDPSPHHLQKPTKTQSTYAPRHAYVTVLHSSQDYVCGAIALAQSILRTNTSKDLVLLADHIISHHSILGLELAGWKVIRIDRIKSPNAGKYDYNKWNYSKLRIWELIEYHKLMFIDSDFIVLKNIDKFFNYPQLSASPNNRWRFNSGIMILEPSKCFFEYLLSKRYTLKSYNGGDQGYLNEVLTWWHRLTLKLNFLKYFLEGDDERLVPKDQYTVHFLGLKPWLCYRDYDCNWDLKEFHKFASNDAHAMWWQVYDSMPKKLQNYCGMTRKHDKNVRNWKEKAKRANFSNAHWRIEIKDPRQYDLKGSF